MIDKQQTASMAAFQSGQNSGETQTVSLVTHQVRNSADFSVVRWRVGPDQITYQRPEGHTLSCYLEGGESSFRLGQRTNKGAAGKLCLMPQGHESCWQINGEIDFMHLYFSDELLKQHAASQLNMDVRFIELPDLTYKNDAQLQQLLFACLPPEGVTMPMADEMAVLDVLHHLLRRYNTFDIAKHQITGGLSAWQLRILQTQIKDELAAKHSIASLACSVNLSPFHFARMFKLSFGESPATYVNRLRIETVKQLLRSKAALSDIAISTGFSHQSHMNKCFKALTHTTPARYRQIVHGVK